MTKRVWTSSEPITKALLDTLLQDLVGEPLYGGVEALVNTDVAVAAATAIATLDATTDVVEIVLPEATGSGRILAFVCINADNTVTVIREGAGVINAAGVTLTFDVWENALLIDIGADQWAMLAGTAALT